MKKLFSTLFLIFFALFYSQNFDFIRTWGTYIGPVSTELRAQYQVKPLMFVNNNIIVNGNVMNNTTFQQFMNTLQRNASFDRDKKEFILQQVRNNNFTSNQIAALVKTFSFDNGRLDMAKTLFKNCVDKENYFVVTNSFDFDKSKKDLMTYISKS